VIKVVDYPQWSNDSLTITAGLGFNIYDGLMNKQ